MAQPTRIAIIGAGPAGLTLARMLQHHADNKFIVQVFERDADPNTRQQGGTLDLHPKTGQLALEQAGLIDKFWAKARPEGQDMKILDKKDETHLALIAEDGAMERPEIDRTSLRDILKDSLHPNTIQWGYKLLSVTPKEDCYTLKFDNGREVESDVVVGADGAWSKVRNLLTDLQPEYTGITFVEICLTDIDTRYPDLGKYVGRGSLLVFADCKGIQAQRISTGAVRVYVGLTVPSNWIATSGIQGEKPDEVRKRLLGMFADWTSASVDLIRNCDDDHIIPRALYSLPVAADSQHEKEGKWPKHHQAITLVGDAAHLTAPSGRGVNYAMLDAMELANSLIQHTNGTISVEERNKAIAEAVTSYQKELFKRCREAPVHAEKLNGLMFAADSPISFVAEMKNRMAAYKPG